MKDFLEFHNIFDEPCSFFFFFGEVNFLEVKWSINKDVHRKSKTLLYHFLARQFMRDVAMGYEHENYRIPSVIWENLCVMDRPFFQKILCLHFQRQRLIHQQQFNGTDSLGALPRTSENQLKGHTRGCPSRDLSGTRTCSSQKISATRIRWVVTTRQRTCVRHNLSFNSQLGALPVRICFLGINTKRRTQIRC